jgi:hypothetical protein
MRTRFRIAAATAVLALASSACSSGTYLGDRGSDFAECFTLTVSAGPELSVDAKLTEALHLAVGGGVHVEAGMIGGEWGSAGVAMLGLPISPFMEDGIVYGRFLFTDASGGWTDELVQDECYGIHLLDIAPTNPQRDAWDRWDLELGVTVLVGARVGFSPGQFVDFVAGVFGGDPAGDDGAAASSL